MSAQEANQISRHVHLPRNRKRVVSISLVNSERCYQSQRVKALVDFLVEQVPHDPRWHDGG